MVTLVLLGAISIIHLMTGASGLSVSEVWQSLLAGPASAATEPRSTILWSIRLPRLCTAIIVGGGLSIAGAALQGLFRNPLADPYVLGIASGGAFGAALAMWLLGQIAFGPTAGSFLGALSAGILVLIVTKRHGGFDLYSVLLAGVAVGLLFSALLSFVLVLAENQAGDILVWLLGSVGHTNWQQLGWMTCLFALGTTPLLILSRTLDTIQLGENAARGLGVDIDRVKLIILVSTSLLVASAVAYCGLIGFVGLVIPHCVRLLIGPSHRWLLILSGVGGALLLVSADLAARLLMDNREMPVGVVTALVGGPFFLFLLGRGRSHA
jgi:iron complex transport system permease protein